MFFHAEPQKGCLITSAEHLNFLQGTQRSNNAMKQIQSNLLMWSNLLRNHLSYTTAHASH